MTGQRTFAVTGASGLVGRALCERLRSRGDRIIRLVRRSASAADELSWDPESGGLDATRLAGIAGVVHLAGENVATRRWSPEFKKHILDSRVVGTRTLVAALERTDPPPRVLVSASGVGFYGDRGSQWVDESSPAGEGFLVDVCKQWEDEARKLSDKTRTVQLRIGMVLSRKGGALAEMLPVFRFGLGGRLGSGDQYVSWIHLDDLVSVVLHALDSDMSGPVNAVGPAPVTQNEFAHALGRALRRPAFLPVPGFALRTVLGEFAGEVLGGQRVRPQRLLESGFVFGYSDLPSALSAALS